MKLIKGDKKELRTIAKPIHTFDVGLRKSAYALARCLAGLKGYALAANQVCQCLNNDINLCVIDAGLIKGKKKNINMLFVCNLEIISKSKNGIDWNESCLSFPGKEVNIYRPESVTIKYNDLYGNEKELSASGLMARVIQHENDHLNGKLIIDY